MPAPTLALLQSFPIPPASLSPRLRFCLGVLAVLIAARLLLLLYGLIRGPFVLRAMKPSNAIAKRMLPVTDAEMMPAPIRDFLDASRRSLDALGFNRLAIMRAEGSNAWLTIGSDAAGVVATALAVQGQGESVARLVGFTTRLASGARVRTTNSTHDSPWPPRRGDDVVRLPEPDVGRLHAIHNARVARHVAKGARIAAIVIDDPIAFQTAEEQESLDRAVSSGYFVRDGSEKRMTWKGACLSAWRLSSPFKELRESRAQQLHRSLLRTIGVSA